MTITCSNCGCPFVPDSDRTVVACDFCGHRTFNPYAGEDNTERDFDQDEEEDSDPSPARAPGAPRGGAARGGGKAAGAEVGDV